MPKLTTEARTLRMARMQCPTITRRRFIARAAQATLAVGSVAALPAILAGEEPSFPIIDTHQHLWDLTKVRLSRLKPGDPFCRNFVMQDYREATAGLGIVKAVYMEVDTDTDSQLAEAEYVIDICRRGGTPTVAAVIGGCPGEDSFKPYIARFKDSPYIKGVRQLPRPTKTGQSPYREKPFVQNIRLLGRMGMRFDLCPPPAYLPDAVRLVDDCPDTQFILDHCGNADPKWFCIADKNEDSGKAALRRQAADEWRRGIDALAKRTNVVCKISGIIARAPKDHWMPDDLAPPVNYCLDAFGPNRVMFASDWPVCTIVASLAQWVGALKQIVRRRSLDEQRKLFCDNALRVYGLAGR